MPLLTNIQKSAFDAIDTLHFGQAVMGLIYGKPIEEWYPKILGRINGILQKARMTGKQAEITKHYVLVALEIYLSIDSECFSGLVKFVEETNADEIPFNRETYEQVVKYERNVSLTMLSIIASHNGVDKEFFLHVAEELINDKELALSTMPYLVKYRLTECCYAFEYPDAPFLFYHELVNRNIISCGKYSRNIDKYTHEPSSELSLLFIRAGLLFELKMLQSMLEIMISHEKNGTIIVPSLDPEISRADRTIITDYYKRLVDLLLRGKMKSAFVVFQCKEHVSEIKVEKFLKNMNRFYLHKRMFGGTQGSWLGTLGAFDIEVSCSEERKPAIYYEADNSCTITEKIKLKFLDYGFSVSARSLYLRHKAIKKDGYSKVRFYYLLLLNQQLMLPRDFRNNDCYDLALKYKKEDVSE